MNNSWQIRPRFKWLIADAQIALRWRRVMSCQQQWPQILSANSLINLPIWWASHLASSLAAQSYDRNFDRKFTVLKHSNVALYAITPKKLIYGACLNKSGHQNVTSCDKPVRGLCNMTTCWCWTWEGWQRLMKLWRKHKAQYTYHCLMWKTGVYESTHTTNHQSNHGQINSSQDNSSR